MGREGNEHQGSVSKPFSEFQMSYGFLQQSCKDQEHTHAYLFIAPLTEIAKFQLEFLVTKP